MCVLDKRERENFTLSAYSQQLLLQSSTWLKLMMASCYFYVLHKTFISPSSRVHDDGETASRHAPLSSVRATVINSIVNGHISFFFLSNIF